jgi:hypothetical protein
MQKLSDEETLNSKILLNNISEITHDGYYTLFIRHADRNKIPDGEFGDEVELNEKGLKNALNFGEKLKYLKINKIFSSPIKRCIQTAECILKGAGLDIPIQNSKILGDPGAFVFDGKQAGDSFLELGFNTCYENQIKQIAVSGCRDIAEGTRILNRFFINELDSKGLNIMVSHDMLLALYAWHSFGKKYTLGENWVKFLDGLIIKHL